MVSRPQPNTPGDELELFLTQVQQLTQRHREEVPVSQRRGWGQYFTPLAIAQRMASLVSVPQVGRARILDPGAGTGMLGVATAVRMLAAGVQVELTAIEPEPRARQVLVDTYKTLKTIADTFFPKQLHCRIVDTDFLQYKPGQNFDVVVTNPPYQKMSPKNPAGGDSPNLYTRFMEVAAGLLRPGGELVCIVPRSFTSGTYFRRFRQRLSQVLQLEVLHVFASRRAAFASDRVLQETVICRYRAEHAHSETVRISCSSGTEPENLGVSLGVLRRLVVGKPGVGDPLKIPCSPADLACLEQMSRFAQTLADLGVCVSTGRVVPFRNREFLHTTNVPKSVPLLWMQHVLPKGITWPLGGRLAKPEWIAGDAPVLIANANYVFVRRVSSKDEPRRLTVCPYTRSLAGDVIGVENHINYLYRQSQSLTPDEVWGLATWLNSQLVDRYVRITNGHTQINAGELRRLPTPPLATITAVGQCARAGGLTAAQHMLQNVLAEPHTSANTGGHKPRREL